jgi:hypothetical protein
MITRAPEQSTLTYARVAGFTFLFYIAAGLTGMALPNQPGLADLTYLLTAFSALVLAVTLYLITRAHGPALALLAALCRVAEALSGEAALSAIFFAVGSLLFCWLFIRGRLVQPALAWLGLVASVLLVVILPLQQTGLLGGETSWSSSLTWIVWLPMLVFELALAVWLMVRGVARPLPGLAAV